MAAQNHKISAFTRDQTRLIVGTALVLLLAASRILRFSSLQMHSDEIWSIWQTFGTPIQILNWTPFDWPPLYFLLVGGWKEFAGIHPLVLRLLSTFLFLIAAAVLYRIFIRLRDIRTAALVVLSFGALGFGIRISTEVRGYMLMFMFYFITFWLTERYFARPSLRRGLLLALSIAVMFYSYLPGLIGFFMIGVYTLIVYPHRLLRWWLPGGIAALLALPLILLRTTQVRDRFGFGRALSDFSDSLADYFTRFTTYQSPNYSAYIWIILAIVATSLLIYYWRQGSKRSIAFFVWMWLMPLFMYLTNPITLLFYQHYSMALILGIAAWVGWGLGYLRKWALTAAFILLAGLNIYPFTTHYEISFYEPFDTNMQWLSEQIHAGDVLLIDPYCSDTCEIYDSPKWDYYTRLYFPNGGLNFAERPGDYRRIWYITNELDNDPEMAAAVRENRIPGVFVGPAEFFWRLYEAPPDAQGILFENGMRFHGADVVSLDGNDYETGPLVARREGEKIKLRLWWSVSRSMTEDYSVGTYILSEDQQVLTQIDGAPQVIDPIYPYDQIIPQQTSQWQPGQYYIEERELVLPYPADAGRFSIQLALYQWTTPEQRERAPAVDENGLLFLNTLTLVAW
jgi:hypothetical protein